MPFHQRSFTVALTLIASFLVLRDRIFELFGSAPCGPVSGQPASRQRIPSGANLLDAAFVQPAGHPAQAALLICHGIGETVGRWLPVQQLLAAHGVCSLVFDYSGYGRSTGTIGYTQCELDAIAAFGQLESLAPHLPVSILGFSLGTGIAAAIMDRIQPAHLILGASFTSFRAASRESGIPGFLAPLVPPIWDAREALRNCAVPLLVLHGEKDGLFPVSMAREVAACCPSPAELVVVPGVAHNQPFRRPELSYWGHVLTCLIPSSPA
jgi:pimeloyl-ACP methyl ester carboxylesterase